MPNWDQVKILELGAETWNKWREDNAIDYPDLSHTFFQGHLGRVNLRNADLSGTMFKEIYLEGADLSEANLNSAFLIQAKLHGANLYKACLKNANLTWVGANHANFTAADLEDAVLSEGNFLNSNFEEAYLVKADCSTSSFYRSNFFGADLQMARLHNAIFIEADLRMADLRGAFLIGTDLTKADLRETDLRQAVMRKTGLIETNLSKANLCNCRVYGISAWNVILDGAIQNDLLITPEGEAEITIDNLEIAQFVYLLLHNAKLRNIIDTLTTKTVLILGRFTKDRKVVLDAIREELRKHGYIPIVFDFEKPDNRDMSETIMTLASLSRFVIADLSDPNSSPHEVMSFARDLPSVPISPIFCSTLEHPKPYSMFVDHLGRLPHVLPIYEYKTSQELMALLEETVIRPAEEKAKEVRPASFD